MAQATMKNAAAREIARRTADRSNAAGRNVLKALRAAQAALENMRQVHGEGCDCWSCRLVEQEFNNHPMPFDHKVDLFEGAVDWDENGEGR
jgi:hypothetical protein